MKNYNEEEIGNIIDYQKKTMDMIWDAMFKPKKKVEGYGGGWMARHNPEELEKITGGYPDDFISEQEQGITNESEKYDH